MILLMRVNTYAIKKQINIPLYHSKNNQVFMNKNLYNIHQKFKLVIIINHFRIKINIKIEIMSFAKNK